MARRIGRPGGTPEQPATFFTGPEEFRAWLEAHAPVKGGPDDWSTGFLERTMDPKEFTERAKAWQSSAEVSDAQAGVDFSRAIRAGMPGLENTP